MIWKYVINIGTSVSFHYVINLINDDNLFMYGITRTYSIMIYLLVLVVSYLFAYLIQFNFFVSGFARILQ